MQGRLLKISTSEAYEEEFFRRGFRSFSEDFRPLDTRPSAPILLLPSRLRVAAGEGGRGMRADLFPVINLRGLALSSYFGGRRVPWRLADHRENEEGPSFLDPRRSGSLPLFTATAVCVAFPPVHTRFATIKTHVIRERNDFSDI